MRRFNPTCHWESQKSRKRSEAVFESLFEPPSFLFRGKPSFFFVPDSLEVADT